MSHPYPLPAGVVLNKQYRIVRVLGSGGFGITYLAEDIRLQKSYAVKEYFPNAFAVRLADNSLNIHDGFRQSFQEGLRYFYNEARKADMLQHSNIVQIAALFEENNTAYLVMPYLHGETLRAWLERHPQPALADLQNIFLPLLDALAYMHRAEIEFYDERRKQKVSATGVLHLDIKPDNILLAQTQAGQTPMLIDFGAARHHTESHGYAYRTDSNFKPHTPHYAAPEHGTKSISPATDIYGLSACLYEAVSGRIPELAARRIGKNDRLAACSDYCRRYPKAWLQVIDKGFDLYQQNRYQSADEMRQALIKASGQNPEPPPKSGKGRLLALWAGIGAGAVLGWGIYQYDGASDEPYPEPAPPPASAAADPQPPEPPAPASEPEPAPPAPETKAAAPDAAEIESLYDQAKDGDTQARERLQELAEQGIAEAQYWLGKIYFYGDGVEEDDEQGLKWFRKAAEQGHASAQYNLGLMYDKGYGVDKDYEQALKWYLKAAEQGSVSAQYNLGLMYLHGKDGKGVVQDYEQAVKWFRKAAEQGDAQAQYNLGLMYDDGKGVEKDYKQAVAWYRKAAEQGHAPGQNNLGFMYRYGKGVAQDNEQAVAWYRKAAEQGNVWGQYNLGWMYRHGYGVAQDDEQALKWYRKAAEQGYAGGQTNLGLMYEFGNGVAQDREQAVYWYRKAAEQGNKDAQYALKRLQAE